jgi:anthranilate phosphoribosyltransferase
VSPKDAGLAHHPLRSVSGGTPDDNARMLRSVLGGERGALRDFTLLNAAAGLLACGLAGDLAGGVARAADAIDSGGALAKLDRFIEVSNATG